MPENRKLYMQIYDYYKELIESGRLEKGMRLNPDASYRGNMAQWVRRPALNGKGTKWVAIPKPWRKVGMFEKTYNYVKTNYADILQRAFKAAGCEVKGVPNGQPKVRRN